VPLAQNIEQYHDAPKNDEVRAGHTRNEVNERSEVLVAMLTVLRSLLGCYDMSNGKWMPKFRWSVVPPSSG
jgi:hypothetical protein